MENMLFDVVSIVDNNYKPKGYKSLNKFEQVELTEKLKEKYHIYDVIVSSPYQSYLYLDGEVPVALFSIKISPITNISLLYRLYVFEDYRNYFLADQIMDYVIYYKNVTNLFCFKDNEIALNLYFKHDFVVVNETEELYEMKYISVFYWLSERNTNNQFKSLYDKNIFVYSSPQASLFFNYQYINSNQSFYVYMLENSQEVRDSIVKCTKNSDSKIPLFEFQINFDSLFKLKLSSKISVSTDTQYDVGNMKPFNIGLNISEIFNKFISTYSSLFSHVKEIVNSFSSDDLLNIKNFDFYDSSYVIYRKVLLLDNEPASFVEIYNSPNFSNGLIIGTKEKFRNRGLLKQLLSYVINEVQDFNINPIYYETNKSNFIARILAEITGFKLYKQDDFKEIYSLDFNVYNLPEEIINLNKQLNTFDYGVVRNNKKLTGNKLDKFNFLKNYKTLSTDDFYYYKCGVCYDFTHYEAVYFRKNHYKFKTYYIETKVNPIENPSHAFLLFTLHHKIYYFESSWKEFAGIIKFDDLKTALQTILEWHSKFHHLNINDLSLYEIDYTSNAFEELTLRKFMGKSRKGFLINFDNFIAEV